MNHAVPRALAHRRALLQAAFATAAAVLLPARRVLAKETPLKKPMPEKTTFATPWAT